MIVATNPRDAARLVDQSANPILGPIVAKLIPTQLACLDMALRSLPSPQYPVVQDLDNPRFILCYSYVRS